jgi:hypothetical protein
MSSTFFGQASAGSGEERRANREIGAPRAAAAGVGPARCKFKSARHGRRPLQVHTHLVLREQGPTHKPQSLRSLISVPPRMASFSASCR